MNTLVNIDKKKLTVTDIYYIWSILKSKRIVSYFNIVLKQPARKSHYQQWLPLRTLNDLEDAVVVAEEEEELILQETQQEGAL